MKPKLERYPFHSCLAPKRPAMDYSPPPLINDASWIEELRAARKLKLVDGIIVTAVVLAVIGLLALAVWLS